VNSHPAVSVVIATYNYGRFLAGAIDSVFAQTFRDYEIIVVDDGSDDGTGDVVAPYLHHPKLQYIRTEHVGQPKAKNTGIRAARGEYVAFLDADDVWLPAKLEKQVALFEGSDSSLAVVYCRRCWIDEDGQELTRTERAPQRGDVLAPLFHRPFICFSSSVVRRPVFDDVGLFEESLPMSIDYDLWLRIALKYRFDYVDEPLVRYRTGHANLSRREVERSACVREVIGRFLDTYGGRARIRPALVRLVLAEHYWDTGNAYLERSWLDAVPWYLRSFGHQPLYWPSWRALCTCWWPERWKNWLRSILGRPGGARPAENAPG
jgi:glycosyltransferase involved in cell wall biosynthesis